MINLIDWLKEYEILRIMHSHLKSLMNAKVGSIEIPVWFGERKKLPRSYLKALEKIDDALYEAEKITMGYYD